MIVRRRMKVAFARFKDASQTGLCRSVFNECLAKVPMSAHLVKVTCPNNRLIGCRNGFDEDFMTSFGHDSFAAQHNCDPFIVPDGDRICCFSTAEVHDTWFNEATEMRDEMDTICRRHKRNHSRGGIRGINEDRKKFLEVQRLAEKFRSKWTLIGLPIDIQKTSHDDQQYFKLAVTY